MRCLLHNLEECLPFCTRPDIQAEKRHRHCFSNETSEVIEAVLCKNDTLTRTRAFLLHHFTNKISPVFQALNNFK